MVKFVPTGRFRVDQRAQTIQDYTLGISIFVLTIAFVFTLIPSIFAPFTAPIDDSTTAQADRVASSLVLSLSEPDRQNVYDPDRTKTFFQQNQTRTALIGYFGLPSTTHINITITETETRDIAEYDSTSLAAGEERREGPVAATERIVVIDGETYQQTVRIW